MYIYSPAHHRIKKFTADGEPITSWELTGTEGFGSAPSPRGLTVDSEGYVYVIDIANSRIQKYAKVSTTTTTTTLCPLEKIYGEDSRKIKLMRSIRDNVLSQSQEGRELIKLYYQWSPIIARAIEADEDFKEDIKKMVDVVLPLIE